MELGRDHRQTTFSAVFHSNYRSRFPGLKKMPWLRHPPLWPPAAVLDIDSWTAGPQPEICGGWWWRCCWVRLCGSGASESPEMRMDWGGEGGRSYGSDQMTRSPGIIKGEGGGGKRRGKERELQGKLNARGLWWCKGRVCTLSLSH